MKLADRLGADGRLVAGIWLATRLLLLLVAFAVMTQGRLTFDQAFGNWDVAHFVAIARDGYADPQNVAFFPGLPLLLAPAIAVGVDPVLWGVVVSVVTSALAVWALYRLGGRFAAIGWLLAPTAVFTLVAYSESPFTAAAFWSWERATQRKWGQAAWLAALACTFRVSGLFLIGALGVLALVQARRDRRPGSLAASVPWLVLPATVLGAYVVYLYLLTGSWTAWFSAQAAGWMRGFHWPWQALANHWAAIQPGMYADHPGWVEVFRAELAAWLIGVVVVVVALARKKLAEAAWVAVQVLAFSLSYWLQSVTRAILLWFPLWTEIADFAETHRTGGWRVFWAVVVAAAVAVEVIWAWLFFTGRWAS